MSADYRRWFLFNASPDLHRQIEAFPPLWPQRTSRHTPIDAVALTDAELDHTLGLLLLREGGRIRLYATEWVHTALTERNLILRTLGSYCTIEWQKVRLGEVLELTATDGTNSGLRCEAFSTGSRRRVAYAPDLRPDEETTVAYRISDPRTGGVLVYMPAASQFNDAIADQLLDCSCLLIDGTCWDDDELIHLGVSGKTARAMGHLPIAGPGGSLERLTELPVRRRVYVHINNTNPLLIEDSPQRRTVEARGIEVAVDGMEMEC